MRVGWAEMQHGDYDVTLDNQFFAGGPIIEADEAAGTISYIPVDPATGCMLYDQREDGWARRHVSGVVRIYPRRPGERMC
jgi:hypothetical protein